MARTSSNMIPLASNLPNVQLLNVLDNKHLNLHQFIDNQAVLIMFICNHCPFVVHLHQGIQVFYQEFRSNVKFVAISANDVANYPEDSPEKMKLLFEQLKLDFPYLYDKNQNFAKQLDAACTPDFYLFDKHQSLVYRGRFDESRPGNGVAVTGGDLREAINCLLNGNRVSEYQKPSLGCNIKWK